MAGKNTAVYGMYRDRSHAGEAIDRLLAAGFRNEDIAVLLSDNRGTKDFAHEKNTKAPEGTTAGALTGGAIGGTVGLLAGIGAIAIPGLGPFIAAGPIMSTLAGLGAGGAVGGLIGALVGMGIPEYEAKRYEGRIKEGGVLLSVHCDNSDWTKRAKELLRQTGADDISSAGESSADFDRSDKPLPRSTRTVGDPVVRDAPRVDRRSVPSSSPVAVYEYDYEDDFRRDFESNYYRNGVVYEDYAPAYRFGAVCGTDARYTNRDWSTVEPDIRRDWDRQGSSTWERVKDAVRYGWNRARGRA
jgi:hypothetical protein